MSKLIGPIQFQGKLGTIVGRATRKGNISVGMAPTKYTNPNTPKQRTARTRFLAVTAFTSAVPQEAFAGLVRSAKSGKMSLRNAALKYNMAIQKNSGGWEGSTSTGLEEQAAMTKDMLKFSKGAYSTAIEGSPSADVPGKVSLVVAPNAFPVAQGTQIVHHVVLYSPDLGTFYHKAFPTATVDANTTLEIDVPNNQWLGLQAYVYLYTQFVTDVDSDIDYSVFTSNTAAKSDWMAAASAMESTETLYCGKVNIG